MDVILRQVGNNVDLYIDGKVITVFEGKDLDYAIERVQKNLKNAKISVEGE